MSAEEKNVRLQVIVNESLADKIEELAALWEVSTSHMCAKLLEEAMHDNEWFMRVIGTPFMQNLKRIISSSRKEERAKLKDT